MFYHFYKFNIYLILLHLHEHLQVEVLINLSEINKLNNLENTPVVDA